MDKQVIQAFRGEYYFLSNFAPCRIQFENGNYTSVEAAFQAAKCADPAARKAFEDMSPGEARAAGRHVRLRSDWEQVKERVMLMLLRIKFKDPELLGKLLGTGEAVLVEGNLWHDNFWGSCTCGRCQGRKGKNRLGGLLMQVRGEYLGRLPHGRKAAG